MKNYCLLIAIGCAMLISSCSKDRDTISSVGPAGSKGETGATGLMGATGATGSTGAQGTAGTVDVIVKTFTFTPSEFIANTADYNTNLYRHSVAVSASEINSEVYNNGVVLAYYLGYGTTPRPWYALPFSLHQNNIEYGMIYDYYTGYFNFQQYPSDYVSENIQSDITIKLVIIPATGKKEWNVDLKDYNAVKAYFKIAD